jgi:hypothetical protein
LAHTVLNSFLGRIFFRPITQFIVNIERNIERQQNLQRGLVICFLFRLGKILNSTTTTSSEEASCLSTSPDKGIFLIMKSPSLPLDPEGQKKRKIFQG